MIYLNLAFDHELSLGGVTSSYEKNLLAPTRRILELADSLSVPLTFFTDVLCGLRFREWETDSFSADYEEQLRQIVRMGHDIQLHLHPHWIDSTYEDGRFVPATRYSLHDFRNEAPPNDIDGIVGQGVAYLEEVLAPVDAEYRCHAFRAGGLVIEPSQDEIVAALYRHGIRYDSSVAPGYRFDSTSNGVDFSDAPTAANWMLGDEGLYEVPIATAPRTPINNLPGLIRRVLRRSEAPATGGFPLYDVKFSTLDKLSRLFPRTAWFLSFDLFWADGDFLLSILRKYIASRDVRDDQAFFVSTLSHPKAMGPGGLRVMAEFVEAARTEYGAGLEFVTFADIVRLSSGRGT